MADYDCVKLYKPYKLNFTPFTGRGFCFGCDEGRNGRVIHRQRSFNSDPRARFDEEICEGCDMIMDLFRLYIPEVIQTFSHEGIFVWIIESEIYRLWKKQFDAHSYTSDSIQEEVIDGVAVAKIMMGDASQDPEHVMRVLLKAGANKPLSRVSDYGISNPLYSVKLLTEISRKGKKRPTGWND
jgi:hypothetical protein